MEIQIPRTRLKRVVIIGGGFGGITFAEHLDEKLFQVVLIDKYNYHQFQPLLYQVASSGLEPSSISFPFRKMFDKKKNFYFRLAEVTCIHSDQNRVETNIGTIDYDYLVIAAGTTTNFFGNEQIMTNAIPMKSVEEALSLRNTLLLNLEKALDCSDPKKRQGFLNVVIVGGGATGVEIAGAISEMKRYIIPKDYPDLKDSNMNIYLIEGTGKLLSNMTEESSATALKFLKKMGVKVVLNNLVVSYENGKVVMQSGREIKTETLIWVSGVTAERFGNLSPEVVGKGGRLLVNEYNQLKGYVNIFAIGDICLQNEEDYPMGHPQVAPVAIQQGKLLANNLKRMQKGNSLRLFRYNNQGTLATIGRNKAVADIKKIRLSGFPAWAVWMLVHLRSILGVKNKLMVLIDWIWNYVTYDQSQRFILFVKPRKEKNMKDALTSQQPSPSPTSSPQSPPLPPSTAKEEKKVIRKIARV